MIILYMLAAGFSVLAGPGWAQPFGSSSNSNEASSFVSDVCKPGSVGPGLTLLMPIADRLEKVNMQIITMPVPAQDGITRDNVTVRVDAVIYFNVADPVRVVVDVQDYVSAIGQVAQNRCVRSSAKATWTTCSATARVSIRAWS